MGGGIKSISYRIFSRTIEVIFFGIALYLFFLFWLFVTNVSSSVTDDTTFKILVFFLITSALVWIGVFVHELGHAAAALATGRRVHAVSTWPVTYLACLIHEAFGPGSDSLV